MSTCALVLLSHVYMWPSPAIPCLHVAQSCYPMSTCGLVLLSHVYMWPSPVIPCLHVAQSCYPMSTCDPVRGCYPIATLLSHTNMWPSPLLSHIYMHVAQSSYVEKEGGRGSCHFMVQRGEHAITLGAHAQED